MMTSMSLSILDDKDMNTSFFSQTTFPDNESLIDSLPPSLVSSVNSSYVVNTKPKIEGTDSNIFSSATFTHLEQSERLLSARPRCQLYNSYTKRESGIRNTESYTKSREEACQIDQINKVLNENSDNKDTTKISKSNDMSETITLHFSNNKYKNKDAEKENLNETFETDDAFYRDNGLQKVADLVKNSLNVTCDKQELNEIKQARQKLSLARRGLPIEPDKPLPNQVDPTAVKIQLPNQTITVPRQSVESVSELMKRRSQNLTNHTNEEPARETPKRNATFRKVSPRQSATVVYVKSDDDKIIDINSATMSLIGAGQNTLQPEVSIKLSSTCPCSYEGSAQYVLFYTSLSAVISTLPNPYTLSFVKLNLYSHPRSFLNLFIHDFILSPHNMSIAFQLFPSQFHDHWRYFQTTSILYFIPSCHKHPSLQTHLNHKHFHTQLW